VGGAVVPILDGRPGTPVVVKDVQLQGIACPTATTCAAVGWKLEGPSKIAGVMVPLTDGHPGTTLVGEKLGALSAVACPSATTCEAVGENVPTTKGEIVSIVGGIFGSPVVVPSVALLAGVACTSATCEAVGQTSGARGAVVRITDGTPGRVMAVAAGARRSVAV
jgi:hypothetical protein